MLEKRIFDIASIYVPLKRANTLNAEKVRAIPEHPWLARAQLSAGDGVETSDRVLR